MGRDRTMRIMVVAVVVALAGATWSGVAWWRAATAEDLRYAQLRDEVLTVGSRLLVELNTVDYRDATAGLDRWRSAATGALLDKLDRSRDGDLRDIVDQRTVAEAGVVAAAVRTVNEDTGTASMIVAIEVRLSGRDERPATTRSRLAADLIRTDQGWKISSLDVVGQGGS